VYEGEAAGYRGVIRVRVRVEEGAIAEVHIIESSEDKAVGGAAMEELLDLVLAYNTTSLDAVSGATESSRGILAAVENALGSAE
jgi:fumarate reductase flavoprotein subunit